MAQTRRKKAASDAEIMKQVALNMQAEVEKITTIHTTKYLKPVTANHRQYCDLIKNNTITICVGPSGTGKTATALFQGCMMFNRQEVSKIVYVRSLVGMQGLEEDLGSLPGDLDSKLAPLLNPVIDNLAQFMHVDKAEALIRSGVIEVSTMSLLRGRSFVNCFVLLDEAQNCNLSALKTALTRIGEGSKMVVTGDSNQVDIHKVPSGLKELVYRLQGVEDVGIVCLDRGDILRHPIISHVLERLET